MPEASLLAALLPLPLTLAVAVIDLRHGIIPDGLNLALLGLGLGLAAAFSEDGALRGTAFAAAQGGAAYLVFRAVRAAYALRRGRSGLGLGDVKFLAAATSIVGLAGLPLLVLVASLAALLTIGLAALSGRAVDAQTRLPFGPFLALGFHVAALAGSQALPP